MRNNIIKMKCAFIICSLISFLFLVNGEKCEKSNNSELTERFRNNSCTYDNDITSLFQEGSGTIRNISNWSSFNFSKFSSTIDNSNIINNVSNALNSKAKPCVPAIELSSTEKERAAEVSILTRKILTFSKPFDSSLSPSVSKICLQHTRTYLNALKNLELWALKMLDSSGHLPSGILNGNINQFGDFDQCLNIQAPVIDLRGQYCLAYLQLNVPETQGHLKKLHSLVQSHGAFRSEFSDPGHRVPRFSLINWALCVPSSCSPGEIEYSLREYVKNITSGTGLHIDVRIDPRMCQTRTNINVDASTKLVATFFILVIAICCVSTMYDYKRGEQTRNEWLTAFSLRKNSKWLFSMESAADDIKTVHGIRFFNALMLLLSHKSMAIFFNPYINRTYLSETLGKPWTVIGRAAAVYTDPFLLFSGMLTTYSLIGRLKRGQQIKLGREYFGRLLRILPTLGALILFCTFILPLIGSGPQWNLVVRHHSDLCKKYWWRNLLFIQNYFGFSNMCLTHTHHIGIDTELFLFAPIIVMCLWKWPYKGVSFLIVAVFISTGARFYTAITNELSNYIYFGATIKILFKTADYMYSFPPHRATVYLIGILVGYTLRVQNRIKLSNNALRFGWLISIICFFGTLFAPAPMGDINYIYNPLHAAYYAAFAPITWCTLFVWLIFTSHSGYDSSLSRVLSWRGFQITTKLSYAVYLTQFPVFFFNVGRRRTANYYSFIPLMLDTSEYLCIFFMSVLLTLMFEAPFQNIKQILFRRDQFSQFKLKVEHRGHQTKKTLIYSEKYIKNILD